MSDNNTMGKAEFWIEHIIWGLITFLWYKVLFRCIGDYSLIQSRLILCGAIVFVSGIFGIFEFNKARNGFSVFVNLVSGYGAYTVFTYLPFKSGLIQISLLVTLFFSVFCVVYIMSRKIKNRKRIKKILLKRIHRSILSIQTIFSFGMTAIVLEIGVNGILGNSILHSNSTTYFQSNIEEQTLASNIETVALLEESRWKELTAQEKIDVLQVIANIERRYLGLPHELNVGATNLNEGILGNYSDSTHQITVDLEHLRYDSSESVLNTLLHEAYHAYEHRCWDAYIVADEESKSLQLFRKVEKYGAEFADYVDGDENVYEYYMQTCEEDARNYAESAAEDYYEKINAFYGTKVIGDLDNSWGSFQMPYYVRYEDDGYAYLLDQGNKIIAGPYLYIEDEIGWVWDEACRYTGMNGMIGYLDSEGREITSPVFIEASKMRNGKAIVREDESSIYYINGEGERITDDFQDGFPFEHQGCFARVKDDTGWGIINRDGEMIFSGADSIEELPMVTVVGSAVKNHHALIFNLDYGAEEEFQVIKEFAQFNEISYMHYDSFAIVKNAENLYGVVNYKGEVIVEDQYLAIDFDVIDDGDDSWLGCHVRFKLQNKDGSYMVKEIKI